MPEPAVDWIGLYLLEDVGPGDATSDALFSDEQGSARIVARERALVAGTLHARTVFARLGAHLEIRIPDGTWADPGAVIAVVTGPVRAILAGERVALNLVARMSGIATATRSLVEAMAAACLPAVVAATRKTTPGFRAFEKEAVVIGGGERHRLGLWDAMMVKDNHIAAAGSAAEAVRKAKAARPDLSVECEVESRADALAAAEAGADWILIDNQSPETGKAWAEEVWARWPLVGVEASGGIRPDNALAYGWADRISLGSLTQKSVARDVGLDWGST